jgi:hypothetical protein
MLELIKIQSELKAPKNQLNKFGNYKYRSCEDILEAVKPLLLKHGCILTITDEVKEISGILFMEATANITTQKISIEVKAQAGIDVNQKGMSIAQCFGASSSYARKYALNGLFLIDDTKDTDATNTHESAPTAANKTIATPEQSLELAEIIKTIKKANSKEDLALLWDSLDESEQKQTKAIFSKRKLELAS